MLNYNAAKMLSQQMRSSYQTIIVKKDQKYQCITKLDGWCDDQKMYLQAMVHENGRVTFKK